jgi:hypothetical protein
VLVIASAATTIAAAATATTAATAATVATSTVTITATIISPPTAIAATTAHPTTITTLLPAPYGRRPQPLLYITTTTSTAAATATIATMIIATVYQLTPPGSHRVHAVGPGGVSCVPMKFTPSPRRAPSVPLRYGGISAGLFCMMCIQPHRTVFLKFYID